jgi:hypothetical protein
MDGQSERPHGIVLAAYLVMASFSNGFAAMCLRKFVWMIWRDDYITVVDEMAKINLILPKTSTTFAPLHSLSNLPDRRAAEVPAIQLLTDT